MDAHAHAHPCPWVLGGHKCDIIGNVTFSKYMGAICIAWVGHGWTHVMLWVGMGGHRSLLMDVVWVWVQIRRKCWALVGTQVRT